MTSLFRVHPPSPKDSWLSQVCAEGFGEDMRRQGWRTMLNHRTLGPWCRVPAYEPYRARRAARGAPVRLYWQKGYSRMTQWYTVGSGLVEPYAISACARVGTGPGRRAVAPGNGPATGRGLGARGNNQGAPRGSELKSIASNRFRYRGSIGMSDPARPATVTPLPFTLPFPLSTFRLQFRGPDGRADETSAVAGVSREGRTTPQKHRRVRVA